MVCLRVGNAIVCGRGPRRSARPASQKARNQDPPRCRHPDCERAASQAGWGCRQHWFNLPPDLRNRLWQAATAAGADRRAWISVAEEADRWLAEQLARPKTPSWRQPELPL